MPTTTGFEPHLDQTGTQYAQELIRRGLYMVSELNADAVVAPTRPQLFSILRYTQSSPGNPAVGIPPTFALVTGLTNIAGSVILPAAWATHQLAAGLPPLKETERVIHLVDVPGRLVFQTDRIKYADPLYGQQVFKVVSVTHNPGTNITRLVVDYAQSEAVPDGV